MGGEQKALFGPGPVTCRGDRKRVRTKNRGVPARGGRVLDRRGGDCFYFGILRDLFNSHQGESSFVSVDRRFNLRCQREYIHLCLLRIKNPLKRLPGRRGEEPFDRYFLKRRNLISKV